MNKFDLADICFWTSAKDLPYSPSGQANFDLSGLLEAQTRQWPAFSELSTDSRSIKADQIFLALSGEKFDGHDFLEQVLARGVRFLIVQKDHQLLNEFVKKHPQIIIVSAQQLTAPAANALEKAIKDDSILLLPLEDTLHALGQIACGYRQRLQAKVIAVTGSVGKTSTRTMISHCLQSAGKVHATKANLNNEIGLPQTLLAAPLQTDYLVVELGMRGLGQIESLSRIACPDIGIITNIGWSHLELLGNRRNILKAKTEILTGMREHSDLIINYADEHLRGWYQQQADYPLKVHLYMASCDDVKEDKMLTVEEIVCAKNIKNDHQSSSFDLVIRKEQLTAKLNLPGEHHIENALAALITADLLKVNLPVAVASLNTYGNTGARQRIIEKNKICLLDDTYNAAPESMQAAMKTLTLMAKNNRKIAVLAGIYELGPYGEQVHFEVGQAAARTGFARYCLFGEFAEQIAAGIKDLLPSAEIYYFTEHSALVEFLQAELRPGDYILFKGSRAFAMEKIVSAIEDWLT